jgi:hypothetical protein
VPSRIEEVCAAAAARVQADWGPVPPDLVVGPVYSIDICTDPGDPARLLVGRHVYLFPSAYRQVAADRGADTNEYEIAALVVELYRGEGDPPEDWVRERVEFVEQIVYGSLQDPRRERLLQTTPWNGLYPADAGVDPVFDPEELTQRRLFASLARVTYRETVEA